MAGQFVTIERPGYSLLTTHDVPYVPSGPDDANVFSQAAQYPLIEGEWLEYREGDSGWGCTRAGNRVLASSPTPDNEGTKPAFLNFVENGRTDTQLRRMAHLLKGPTGFTFRTKVIDTTGLSIGDEVAVFDILVNGVVRRGLAAASGTSGTWVVGTVERIHGENHASIYYNPHYVA
jgi:hypothetical protein